jgi:hypothetical protein
MEPTADESQAMKRAKKLGLTSTLVRPGKRGLMAAAKAVLDTNGFGLEEDDNFMAPIFLGELYKGTGAFKLDACFDAKGSDKVFGSVRVMGASNPRLMHTLEERFEEADGLVHFCEDSKCRYEQPGLSVMHLYAYEYISASKLDRLTDDDFIEVNHRYWDKKRCIERSGGTGSSHDQCGRDTTRGRPVKHGPAGSEPSAKEAPMTSETAAEISSLKKELRVLRQRLEDSKSGVPRDRVLPLRDCDRQRDKELTASPPRGGNGKIDAVSPPKSDSSESRVRTPSCRSVEVSQLLVERAVDKELVRQTGFVEAGRPEKRGSHHYEDRSRRRRRSPSSSSGCLGGTATFSHEAHGSRNSARSVRSGLEGDNLAEGYSDMAHSLTKRGTLSSQAAMPPIAATYWVTIARPALRKDAPVSVDRELRTLAEAMDALVTGEVATAGDLLMSRFRAVETGLNAGRDVAQHMEMIPAKAVSSASLTAQRAAPRKEARELHSRDLLGKISGQEHGKGRSQLTSESPLRSPQRSQSPQAGAASKRMRSPTPPARPPALRTGMEPREERRVRFKLTEGPGADAPVPEAWYARLRRRKREKQLVRATTQSLAEAEAAARPPAPVAAIARPPTPAPPVATGLKGIKGKGKGKRGGERGRRLR